MNEFSRPMATLLALSLLAATTAVATEPPDLSNALVRIEATVSLPNFDAPWQRMAPSAQGGSGAIISGQRILTAAHVVAGATMIEVSRADSERRYPAKLEHICHDCDLALLRVPNPEFFTGSRALPIGTLPHPQQHIEVHGFPIGGDGLSITSGIVSRILVDYYVHSWRKLLLVQVDAPINSGNSGGPALHEGQIAGIAAQGREDADNIAFIVPAPVIRHFLTDVEDGGFDGIPTLGLHTQPLQNPAFRAKLGLGDKEGGVFVNAVAAKGPVASVVVPGDVLLEVDGKKVGADGRVALFPGVRVDALYLEQQGQIGDWIEIKFMRAGAVRRQQVQLQAPKRTIPLGADEGAPEFRIYAGLVFQPLTVRYLQTRGDDGPPSHLAAAWEDRSGVGHHSTVHGEDGGAPAEHQVVLSGVLHNELTQGYQRFGDELVYAVDGTRIRSLAHLSSLLDSAKGEFVTITLARDGVLVIPHVEAEATGPAILERYGVARDRSGGLEALPASVR